MLKLLKRRPRGMTKARWLKQRREAARELGKTKERRAVPILLRIVRKERFDVILEIAIDALGEIGDRRAVEPLERLLNDPSLDSYVRDAVAGALKKLDAGPKPRPGPRPGPKPGPKPQPKPKLPDPIEDKGKVDLATRLVKAEQPFSDLPPLDGQLDADLIARSYRWDLAAAGGDLRYDGGAERTEGGVSLRSRYRRQVETRSMGYTVDGAVDLGFRFADSSGQDATYLLNQGLQINPELRYYPFRRDLPLLSGQVIAGVGYGLALADQPLYFDSRLNFASNMSMGVGPAYGRIYDVGQRLRLKRIQYVLKQAKMLTGSIDQNVADQILHAWYTQRNAIGSYNQLGYLLNILDRAGLLAKDAIPPDLVYKLVRILDDPQFEGRDAGMMFRLGFGYAHSFIKDADDDDLGFLYATARYEHQWVRRSLGGQMKFFYQMVGREPDHFSLSVEGALSHYMYSDVYEPLGALSATVALGLSNQPGADVDQTGVAFRALVGGAYAMMFNRGTRLRAKLEVGLQDVRPLVLFTLEAQYGFAYGAFASAR